LDIIHKYPYNAVDLTLFNPTISEEIRQNPEQNDIRRIRVSSVSESCAASDIVRNNPLPLPGYLKQLFIAHKPVQHSDKHIGRDF